MANLFDPNNLPSLQIPKIDIPELYTPTSSMWSDTQFEIIKDQIQQFEETLDDEHEVGVRLTNFGQSILMQVTEISYEESVVLIFKGLVNGKPSVLIQHINQLNFLLTSIEKLPDKPKRTIGFSDPNEK